MDEGLVNKNPENDAFQPADVLSTAPPPPSEVKVRTMRSDLESMAKSGGGMPSFANVKVSGLDAPELSETVVVRAKSKSNFLVLVLILIIVAVVAAAGWFAYTFFLNGRQTATSETSAGQGQQQTPPATTPTAAATSTNAQQPPTNQGSVPILNLGTASTDTTPTPSSPPAPGTALTHASFFKIPADQILKLTIALTSAGYDKQILSLLAATPGSDTMFEIDAKDSSGNAASINELLAAQNAAVLNPLTLASDFNPDATFFVYRDANGSWPGYVIGLAHGQSSVSVQGSVQQIESSSNIANLFLTDDVGTASSDGFTDSIIASSSVRVLPFFGGAIPVYFTYGWTPDNQYLILSTSQNGFAAALQRLGY